HAIVYTGKRVWRAQWAPVDAGALLRLGVGRVCADPREILVELMSEPPLGGSITTRWRGRRITPGALLYPLRDPGSGTPSGPVTVRPLTQEDIERIEAALAAK